MRRKVKAGLIEADHADCAIVVHYEVEATVLGDMGEPIVAERQDNVKRIKLKTLNENTNIARLAQEMVEKCKLIHPSKLPLVERLLEELQEHQVSCLTLTLTLTLNPNPNPNPNPNLPLPTGRRDGPLRAARARGVAFLPTAAAPLASLRREGARRHARRRWRRAATRTLTRTLPFILTLFLILTLTLTLALALILT